MQICHQLSCARRQPVDDRCIVILDFMQNYHNPGRTSFQLLVPAGDFSDTKALSWEELAPSLNLC